ncbi:MAG: hypothetical protein M3N47_04360 [Chloroflexota bacterium]|nr:hypothetical protein [Chloroflexota bacterium]
MHVLGRLIELEPAQDELLERICSGPTITLDELRASGALDVPKTGARRARARTDDRQAQLI